MGTGVDVGVRGKHTSSATELPDDFLPEFSTFRDNYENEHLFMLPTRPMFAVIPYT